MKGPLMCLFLLAIGWVVYAQDVGADAIPADSCQQLPDKSFVVRAILFEGNRVTREHIIMREMEFMPGDTLSLTDYCQQSRKSKQNLLNKALFNFVEIDTIPLQGQQNHKDVRIRVIERWYVWPFPILELAERNFNSWWELRDFSRINYGFFITVNNFRGRMEVFRVLARAGYNQNYYIYYEIPYMTKNQNLGSAIETGVQISRETFYGAKDHKHLFYRSENGYASSLSYARLSLTLRPEIHNLHAFNLGFEKYHFDDTLIMLNPEIGFKGKASFRMFRVGYKLKSDYRDIRAYPLNGHYFEFNAEQQGLGILHDEPFHLNMKTTYDLYRKISARWHWAFTTTGKVVFGPSQPYHLQRGLGYGNDFVRGYELYVVDGRNFGLFKSNLKYTLVKPKVRQIPVSVTERFSKIHYALYLNALFDAGYVYEPKPWPDNFLQNRILYGIGIGLDFVTYYDLVWRFEYSLNHLNQAGFFIHFVAPI